MRKKCFIRKSFHVLKVKLLSLTKSLGPWNTEFSSLTVMAEVAIHRGGGGIERLKDELLLQDIVQREALHTPWRDIRLVATFWTPNHPHSWAAERRYDINM